jgi:hypothetical protein
MEWHNILFFFNWRGVNSKVNHVHISKKEEFKEIILVIFLLKKPYSKLK